MSLGVNQRRIFPIFCYSCCHHKGKRNFGENHPRNPFDVCCCDIDSPLRVPSLLRWLYSPPTHQHITYVRFLYYRWSSYDSRSQNLGNFSTVTLVIERLSFSLNQIKVPGYLLVIFYSDDESDTCSQQLFASTCNYLRNSACLSFALVGKWHFPLMLSSTSWDLLGL